MLEPSERAGSELETLKSQTIPELEERIAGLQKDLVSKDDKMVALQEVHTRCHVLMVCIRQRRRPIKNRRCSGISLRSRQLQQRLVRRKLTIISKYI